MSVRAERDVGDFGILEEDEDDSCIDSAWGTRRLLCNSTYDVTHPAPAERALLGVGHSSDIWSFCCDERLRAGGMKYGLARFPSPCMDG